MRDPLVDLILEAPGWQAVLPELAEIATLAAELALTAAGVSADRFTIALLACDDARIGELNAAFRNSPKPTNVLSWPVFSLAPPGHGELPPHPPSATGDARQPLGDVAIALETVVAEAKQRKLPLKNHATHLILHGCLHLLGYDHQTPRDAAVMEDLERRALARAGIPDPYAQPDN